MKRVVMEFELYGIPEDRNSFAWEDLRWLHEGHPILLNPARNLIEMG